eukprot:CAMPEP_0113944520 /NCGR_PEP_ID=MMETSP1339-20121228/34471_1 /TAXON_ID=94617 /ORGANISM="Fibrocapsa japonica" /LENGTH=246 /DNA_ID=CAMNT_0000949747 /DNA_START=184 /DNA_END=921 /DNA_ORIENTATION=+ /assembly_acc=CAM_ASM_000762
MPRYNALVKFSSTTSYIGQPGTRFQDVKLSCGDESADIAGVEASAPQHPVLVGAWSGLLEHYNQYGHANIPLGSANGKRCKALRRLHHEGKLPLTDYELLCNLKFTFDSYTFDSNASNFETLFPRLLKYEEREKNNFQIPKKYNPDPELGAWVAYIRRIGRDNIDQSCRDALDDVNFAWVSTRKCGSSFMKNWRRIMETCKDCNGATNLILTQDDLRWLRAQAETHLLGKLSEQRIAYMNQLPFNW